MRERLPEQLVQLSHPRRLARTVLPEQLTSMIQTPMALVACSALSTLSLAAQGLANVRHDHQVRSDHGCV